MILNYFRKIIIKANLLADYFPNKKSNIYFANANNNVDTIKGRFKYERTKNQLLGGFMRPS